MNNSVIIVESQKDSVQAPAAGALRNPKAQLLTALLVAVVLSSTASHLLVAWLKIETKTGQPWSVGPSNGKPMAFVAGSSLAGDAISWQRVSAELNQPVGGWGVAGASPYELETFQRRVANGTTTFIVISAYDMNESSLSDFRADVVLPTKTLKELAASRAPWPYSKRVMSQYLVRWLRILFPTIGRSRGVMGELRTKIAELLGRAPKAAEAGPSLAFGENNPEKAYKKARIADWSQADITRKLDALRTAFLGEQSFNGLKRRAFQRMVSRASQTGRAVVVVLPVSRIYAEKFLTPSVSREFENVLAEVQRTVPQAKWIRLDQSPELQANEQFWDLVHMNGAGQQIATERILAALRETPSQ